MPASQEASGQGTLKKLKSTCTLSMFVEDSMPHCTSTAPVQLAMVQSGGSPHMCYMLVLDSWRDVKIPHNWSDTRADVNIGKEKLCHKLVKSSAMPFAPRFMAMFSEACQQGALHADMSGTATSIEHSALPSVRREGTQ
ncbi:hypothetical protein Bbelb_208260 [Branchiostoma belcheri]|nr:hypothetical protein Bbelb_208260 [Branchiostoma belcheri]